MTTVIIAVAIIAVVAGALLVYWWYSRSQTAWLFKGAYATYEGTTTVSFIPVNMTVREEVVDYNSTHAQVLVFMRMESSLTGPIEQQNTSWIDLRKNEHEIEGATLTRTYEDHVYIEGLGTRLCTIYEYMDDNSTWTYYIDKAIGWPVKLKLVTTGLGAFSLDLILKETNIPGLKP